MIADDASRDCRVHTTEAQLCVRHAKLPDEKYRNIQRSLPVTPVSYPFKHVVMKTHSAAQEISILNWENAHVGQLTNTVFLAMVESDVYRLYYREFIQPQTFQRI